MMTTYTTVEDVFKIAATIRDKLLACHETEAANELTGTLECFWTTSSEALVEMVKSLDVVRPACEASLAESDVQLLDDVRSGAQTLLNFQ
jgi:hypothetical protein